MRFIWKVIQRDVGGPIDHEKAAQLAISESSDANNDAKKNKENLKGFLTAIDKQPVKERQDFNDQLEEWYQKGDKVSMRMAGVSENENDPSKSPNGYLKRHAKLSSTFVTWDKKSERPGGLIDFKKNLTAEYKVGLGDLLPPNVKAVNVEKKDGTKIDCIRAQNPQNGRIGYYDAAALSRGQYIYVAVRTGDKFEITRTLDPNNPQAQRAFLREHLAVYKQGAMENDGGDELYYDSKGVALPGTPASQREVSKSKVMGDSSRQLADLQQIIQGDGPKTAPRFAPGSANAGDVVEIGDQKYQRLTREFLERNIGTTEAQTSRWLVPTTFLGQKISVSPLTLPYLKEAESRIKAAGIDFKLRPSAGGCQCYNHRGTRRLDGSTGPNLSKHSWGIALDINPGDHPFGQKWEDNKSPNKMPLAVVKIMEECGFRWGNSFGNADPMHFELNVNPFTSQGIIQSEEGKQGLATLEKFSGKLGDDTRMAWGKAKESTAKSMASLDSQKPPAGKGNPALAQKGPNNGSVQIPAATPGETPKYAKETPNTSIGKKLEQYQDIIVEAANQYNVPVNLIMAVIMQESGGRPELVSHAGAGGLMQLMPATARGEGLTVYPPVESTNEKGRRYLTLDPRDDRMDPKKNIMAAVKLLSWLIKKYDGNLENALSAYNWGPGNMDKLLKGQKKSMPMETQKYAPSILAMYQSLGGDSGQNPKPNQALV